jgi:FkbM family methyltransferase
MSFSRLVARGRAALGPFGGLVSLSPHFQGKNLLIDKLAAVFCAFGEPVRVCSPWPGTKFTVDLRDRIQRQMWCGSYEPHITRCLNAVLRPGDVFLDIGAHIGYHSFFGAKLVDEQGRVYSFEPDPQLHRCLTQNLSCFPQAQAVHCAVWDRDTLLNYERSPVSSESGWGTLTAVRDLSQGQHLSLQAVSLDTWAERIGLPHVRAIKIDAEGSEYASLRGASRILDKYRPVLIMEVNESLLRQAGTSPAQLGSLFTDRNYRLFAFSVAQLHHLDSLASCEYPDCLCLPEDESPGILSALSEDGFSIG